VFVAANLVQCIKPTALNITSGSTMQKLEFVQSKIAALLVVRLDRQNAVQQLPASKRMAHAPE
jgi:hypothetical protein